MPSRKKPFFARSNASRPGGAVAHGARARHAVVLLVRAAVPVLLHVARALVGAGERGADHHARRAGGEVERDVARVAHAAVGPDVLAARARLARAREHRRERRPAGAGLHARRAHRARADVHLHDVGAGVDERRACPPAVQTLPATSGTRRRSARRTSRIASSMRRWWPCAVSSTIADDAELERARRGVGAPRRRSRPPRRP